MISSEFGGIWPYIVGPLVGAILAAVFYRFVILAGEPDDVPEKAPGT